MSTGTPDNATRERFVAALREALARFGSPASEAPAPGSTGTGPVAPPVAFLNPDQERLLLAHFEAVVETNRVMNLTRITSPEDAAVKHYADSLAVEAWVRAHAPELPPGPRVLDVGTGAGFPALPIAVVRPFWHVTAMDGTRKKVQFVGRVAHELNLRNLTGWHARADKDPPRADFDLVLARAVARLDPLLRWLAPWVRAGGHIVAYKSARPDAEEAAAASRLLRALGLKESRAFVYGLELAGERIERTLLIYARAG